MLWPSATAPRDQAPPPVFAIGVGHVRAPPAVGCSSPNLCYRLHRPVAVVAAPLPACAEPAKGSPSADDAHADKVASAIEAAVAAP